MSPARGGAMSFWDDIREFAPRAVKKAGEKTIDMLEPPLTDTAMEAYEGLPPETQKKIQRAIAPAFLGGLAAAAAPASLPLIAGTEATGQALAEAYNQIIEGKYDPEALGLAFGLGGGVPLAAGGAIKALPAVKAVLKDESGMMLMPGGKEIPRNLRNLAEEASRYRTPTEWEKYYEGLTEPTGTGRAYKEEVLQDDMDLKNSILGWFKHASESPMNWTVKSPDIVDASKLIKKVGDIEIRTASITPRRADIDRYTDAISIAYDPRKDAILGAGSTYRDGPNRFYSTIGVDKTARSRGLGTELTKALGEDIFVPLNTPRDRFKLSLGGLKTILKAHDFSLDEFFKLAKVLREGR